MLTDGRLADAELVGRGRDRAGSGAVLTLGMVGFNAGLTGRRSPLTAIVLIVILGVVITLIVDLDRPRGGTLTTSQRSFEDLAEQFGPPAE